MNLFGADSLKIQVVSNNSSKTTLIFYRLAFTSKTGPMYLAMSAKAESTPEIAEVGATFHSGLLSFKRFQKRMNLQL